jgi:uncharacterized protein (TIGR02145 family)
MEKRNQISNYILFLFGSFAMLSVSCKKDKTDPVITWANPADIEEGTLLSPEQLNASANVPGTFFYTPGAGTKLNLGADQVLKVVFIPTQDNAFSSASKTVKINVIPATLTDIDGNKYHTITIGTQTWMAENLRTTRFNDGTIIPEITDGATWGSLITEGVCTYNNTTNADTINTYGRLYNLYAVMSGKLAPTGWHVPTIEEWHDLLKYLILNRYNYDGSTSGLNPLTGAPDQVNKLGKAMTSASGWIPSDVKGAIGNTDYPAKRNASGFNALPAGMRGYNPGDFYNMGEYGIWWSTTQATIGLAYYDAGTGEGWIIAGCGFSVRCVKD